MTGTTYLSTNAHFLLHKVKSTYNSLKLFLKWDNSKTLGNRYLCGFICKMITFMMWSSLPLSSLSKRLHDP